MAGAKRGIVEKLALGVMLLALAWFGLNVALAQMSKADAETIETGAELLLFLEEGEQRAVYLKQGASTGAQLAVTPSDLDCQLESAADADAEPVASEQSNRTALVDGWRVYDEVVVFTAPKSDNYRLRCTDAATELLFPNGVTDQFGMSQGAELRIAAPVDAAPSWVAPASALAASFIIVAVGGILWVVGGFLRHRGP